MPAEQRVRLRVAPHGLLVIPITACP